MLLTLDIGNTQTVAGVFKNERLVAQARVATNKNATADELRLMLAGLLKLEGISAGDLQGCAMACVATSLTEPWDIAIEMLLGRLPVVCNWQRASAFMEADYPKPEEIGQDRLADAVAAISLYGAPVVVVDFGTATNIEVIGAGNVFLGGIIAPGVETSVAALELKASKLPAIELAAPQRVIGKSTVEAMESGIVLGEAKRVDGLVSAVFEELGYHCHVVATGGLATTLSPICETITAVNPELTLEGLRLIFEASGSQLPC